MFAKPTKVEVGQRWRYGDEPPFVDYTIVRVDGRLRMQWDTGGLSITEPVDATVRGDVFLGYAPGFGSPPVAGGGRPAPGIGQVWRHHDIDGGGDYLLFGEATPYPELGPRWQIRKVDGVKKTRIGWEGTVSKDEVARSWTFVGHGALTPAPTAAPAPVVTSKPAEFKPTSIDWGKDVPVKREVYAGGAWLDYERLSDPDPFHLYKRRRENGVEVAAVEATGHDGLTWRQYVERDRVDGSAMACVDMMRGPRAWRPATSWLATDAKPAQSHLYSKPSSPGGGE